MKVTPRIYLFIGALFIFSVGALASSKIDTIYFQKGDRVTGEVKSLEKDLLRVSTDDAGTVKFEWNKVDSVCINNVLRISLSDGEILYGQLFPSGMTRQARILNDGSLVRLIPLDSIVELAPSEARIVDRLDGVLSTGVSYTKASEVLQFDFSGKLQYRARRNLVDADYYAILTRQGEIETTQRQSGGISYTPILPRRWFVLGRLLAESNSELQLDLRTTFGLGGGNNLIQTNSSRLYLAAGSLVNREYTASGDQNNVEGIAVLNYNIFIYDSPEVSFNFNGTLIPSFSNPGRVRSELDTSLRWEMFDDLFLKGTFYNSFDNQPVVETAEKNDWALTLGLEYKL